jgi:asparagine synthase (glutamine-hydrolysing)
MLDTMRHETTYTTGTWVDEALGVYTGWAARSGSFSEQMPLRNERGDLTLAFSGEEFSGNASVSSTNGARRPCEVAGPRYLVRQYEEDPKFPAGLNGRFHGLLADASRRLVILFIDRYGMHRIYFHQSKEAFYFAAEAKAILAACPELRNLDPRGLGEFVTCGCVLENRTLFKDIGVLPPASAWRFQDGTLTEKGTYFQSSEWEEQTTLEPEGYYQELRAVFSEILPRYFQGPERIGMSLTGGLDTRMIMAWEKSPPGSLPCYSFGSMFRDCQDVVIARRVARTCGQTHEVIPVASQFLSQFPDYAERAVYLADGCVDVSHSADLYVNERAAQIAPIRMTGNYGGEVLRRVRAFKPEEPASGLFAPEFLRQVEAAKATYNTLLAGHPLSFALFRQAPWHHYGLLSLEQTQISLRSPFLDNDFVRTVFRAPDSMCANNAVCRRLIQEGNATLAQIRTDRELLNGHGLWAHALRSLITFTIKAEYAYDYGMPQPVARIDHALGYLRPERLFLGRHKFYHYRVWYRDALSKFVQEILLDRPTFHRPYLNRDAVESIVNGHLHKGRNYTSEIHKLLTLEFICRTFLDSKPV